MTVPYRIVPDATTSPSNHDILAGVTRLTDRCGDHEAITMDMLVSETGVSRASLYRRFGSREQIFAAWALERGEPLPTPIGTRQKLLNALGQLLQNRALHTITLDDVAASAGSSIMTLHRHFGGRDALIGAYFESLSRAEETETILADERAPLDEVLTLFVKSARGFLQQHRGLLLTMFHAGNEDLAYVNSLRDSNKTSRKLLTSYFETQRVRGRLGDQEAWLQTAALMSLILGSTLLEMPGGAFATMSALPSKDDEERIAVWIVNQFLHGAAAGRRAKKPVTWPSVSRGRNRKAKKGGGK